MEFCDRCHRRKAGGDPCCSESPAEAVHVPAVTPGKDIAAQLAARRFHRTLGVFLTAATTVAGILTAASLQPDSRTNDTSSASFGYHSPSTTATKPVSSTYRQGYRTGDGSATTTTTTSRTPTSTTSSHSDDALEVLRRMAAEDLPVITSSLKDHWVPQLSSKKAGLSADGIVYDASAILDHHLGLRGRFDDARLVWTGDWGSFKYPDFWVTVQGHPFDTAEQANAWCDNQGLPKDGCYAKRIRTTGGYDGNTKVR